MFPYDTEIQRIGDIITKNSHIDSLNEKASSLASLKSQILQHIGNEIAPSFSVTDCSQTHLTFRTHNASLATHLRFSAPDLVKKLRASGEQRWQYLAIIYVEVGPQQVEALSKYKTPSFDSTNCLKRDHVSTNSNATKKLPSLKSTNSPSLNDSSSKKIAGLFIETAQTMGDNDLKLALLKLGHHFTDSSS